MEIYAPGLSPLLFSTVYRRPLAQDFNSFVDAITNFSTHYRGCIITGDFNINLLGESADSTRLRTFCDLLNLSIVPFGPTHHTFNPHYTGTWIDHFFIDNSTRLISYSQTGVPFAGGHELIDITYDAKIQRIAQRDSITTRSFRNFNPEDFMNSLLSFDWTTFAHPLDCDHLVYTLASNITSALDQHAPRVSFIPKRPPAPWIDDELRQLMRTRNAAHRRARRTRNSTDVDRYKQLRNESSTRIDRAKEDYFLSKLNACKSNKETWGELRHLKLVKSKPTATLEHFVNTPPLLNQYFASICNPDQAPEPALPTAADVPFDESHFFFEDVTVPDLIDCVKSCKSNAEGADRISLDHIKRALPAIYTFLLTLFNFSLQHASFPSEWKKALVVPLPKLKSPASPLITGLSPFSVVSGSSSRDLFTTKPRAI